MADLDKKREKELEKLTKKMNRTEEQGIIVKFIVILFIVVACIVGVYFFTKNVVTKDDKTSESTEVSIDYTSLVFGQLFNRPYDEYYVLAYNKEENLKRNYYANMVSSYSSKGDSIKIYTADLNDSMNEKYYSNDSNPNATSLDELKVGDLTLIKIKNGKISKYIEDEEAIKTELGL